VQLVVDKEALDAASARRATAADFATSFAPPLRALQARISSHEAEIGSLQTRVGTGSQGVDLRALEAKLGDAEAWRAAVDAHRSELMAQKERLSEERSSSASRCAVAVLLLRCTPACPMMWHTRLSEAVDNMGLCNVRVLRLVCQHRGALSEVMEHARVQHHGDGARGGALAKPGGGAAQPHAAG
jgi:hypothetical protein